MNHQHTIHRRQFLIGPSIKKVNKNWKSLKLNNSQVLSYCDTLPIKKGTDVNGNYFVLLGIAVQQDKNRQEPFREMKNIARCLEDVYDTWAGRWILIYKNELHTDFSSLFGTYYTKINDKNWISSSVALLSELKGITNVITEKLEDNKMNWFPRPYSSYYDICSIIPSQILNINNLKIKPRQLFPPEKIMSSEEDALKYIEYCLTTSVKNIAKENRNILVPLSSGYDSRLILAAAINAKVPVKTYTMVKKNKWSFFTNKPTTTPVSKGDMVLPPKIAKAAGVQHKWIPIQNISQNLLNTYDNHTAGQTLENDRFYYASGQWEWIENNDIVLLGQVLGLGHGFYFNKFNKSNEGILKADILKEFSIKTDSIYERAISEYAKWEEDYRHKYNDAIDWREKFYLEQRLAGWLSSLQQGLDLVRGERIHLANSQKFICAIFSLPMEMRLRMVHYEKLIKKMAPELLNFPINPSDPPLYELNKIIILLSRKPLNELLSVDFLKRVIKRIKK